MQSKPNEKLLLCSLKGQHSTVSSDHTTIKKILAQLKNKKQLVNSILS